MPDKLTNKDKEFLNLAIEEANIAYKSGNFPIGAVLTIDNNLIGSGGNKINENKSFIDHAETGLIAKYSQEVYKAYQDKKETVIYSTLEPCIQCLRVSVINFISKIVFITKDPQGGACSVEHDNIGQLYKKWWPEIIYAPVSEIPITLMMKFFQEEVSKGKIDWGNNMIKMFKDLTP